MNQVVNQRGTELSPNARAKCQICKMKIDKDIWRASLAVPDPYSSSGRVNIQYAHAACWMRNVSDGSPATRPTTQSMPYYGTGTNDGWGSFPSLDFSCQVRQCENVVRLDLAVLRALTLQGRAIPMPEAAPGSRILTRTSARSFKAILEYAGLSSALMQTLAAAVACCDPSDNLALGEALPTAGLQRAFAAVVSVALPGAETLEGTQRDCLHLFLLCGGRLSPRALALLDNSERAELARIGAGEGSDDPLKGDSLKGKFTQYSPNSRAHCRDCQALIVEGEVRVGASVFSSSSRHASESLNYWCLACMCAKPTLQRLARIYPTELGKVLPGAELLSEPDVARCCALLGMPPPDAAAVAALADGRRRATRSGRKFGSWGGADNDAGDGGEGGDGGVGGSSRGSSKRPRR